jgi:mannose-6-phosphate isomerase-like protein (cupin superfamily)
MPGARELDFHPAMGTRWEITRSTEDTSGELFESTQWYDPREPGPIVHLHPSHDDTFAVIDGTLEVCIDGEWRSLRAGETVTASAGVPHTFRNASDQTVEVKITMRPAGRSEAFFRDMHRLIHEGKIKRLPPKDPRSAIYAAMLLSEYPDEIHSIKPPNAVFKTLAAAGKALRLKT